MTTVRKIVTSKIDGDHSNNTNTSEIRPFGETSFYIDNSGATDKLALLIFDGQRTHLRSKVLSPGVFYGSNADSGDGSGFDTIKLIPDASLHYNGGIFGNDQYIVVDPTAPNHIHLRAGGTQDASTAELVLGGEQTHIKVSDSNDNVTIKTLDVRGETPADREWIFDNAGKLTLPGGVTVDTDGTLTNGDFNITLKEPMTENTQVFKFTTEPGVGALGFPDGSFQSTAANLDQLEIDGRTILTTVDDAIVVQTSIHPTMTAEAIIGSSLDLLVVDISANDDITVVGAGWEINSGSEQAPTWLPVVSTDVVPGEICSINVPGFEFIAGFTYTFRNTNEDTYQWTFNPNGTLIGPQGSIFSNETSALPKREYFTDKVANYYWDGVSTLYVATAGDTIPAFLLTEEIEGEINQLSPATNNLTLRMTDGDGNSIVGVCSRPTSINNSFSYSQLGGVPGLEFFLVVEWTSSALPAINTLTPLQRFSVDQGTYRDLNIELLEPHGQFEQRLVFRNDGSLEIPEQIQLGNILISSTQNGLTINSSGKIWTFDTNGHLNVPNEIASDQTMLGIRSNTGARLQYQDPLPPNTPGVLNQALVTVDPSGIKLETKSSNGSDPIGSIAAWTFDVDGNLTFPDATVQATAWTGAYSPTTPSDWDGTPPVSIAEAIDRLAARVKLIGGGVGA